MLFYLSCLYILCPYKVIMVPGSTVPFFYLVFLTKMLLTFFKPRHPDETFVTTCVDSLVWFSFLQFFSGRQLGDYFPNQVASSKILVAMAPKVVAASRVENE